MTKANLAAVIHAFRQPSFVVVVWCTLLLTSLRFLPTPLFVLPAVDRVFDMRCVLCHIRLHRAMSQQRISDRDSLLIPPVSHAFEPGQANAFYSRPTLLLTATRLVLRGRLWSTRSEQLRRRFYSGWEGEGETNEDFISTLFFIFAIRWLFRVCSAASFQ